MPRSSPFPLPNNTSRQNNSPHPLVPRWQVFCAYAVLFAIPFAVVGICLLPMTLPQRNVLLGLLAGAGLTAFFWMLRKLPREHWTGRQKKITKPQHITAGRALVRCFGFCFLITVMALLTTRSVVKHRVLDDSSHIMMCLIGLPLWFVGAKQNYRLYKKAKQEGPLVIMPSSLPPHEITNLSYSKSVANLDHAVPESQIAKADSPVEQAARVGENAGAVTHPVLEETTSQTIMGHR